MQRAEGKSHARGETVGAADGQVQRHQPNHREVYLKPRRTNAFESQSQDKIKVQEWTAVCTFCIFRYCMRVSKILPEPRPWFKIKTHSVLNLVEKVAEHRDDVEEHDAEAQRHRGEVAEDGLRGDHVEAVLHGQVGDQPAVVVSHRPTDGVYHRGLHVDGWNVQLESVD